MTGCGIKGGGDVDQGSLFSFFLHDFDPPWTFIGLDSRLEIRDSRFEIRDSRFDVRIVSEGEVIHASLTGRTRLKRLEDHVRNSLRRQYIPATHRGVRART